MMIGARMISIDKIKRTETSNVNVQRMLEMSDEQKDSEKTEKRNSQQRMKRNQATNEICTPCRTRGKWRYEKKGKADCDQLLSCMI